MDNRLPRWVVSVLLVLATLTMTFVATDAQARRFGGGLSFGRQSTNIMKQRQAVKPPVAKTAPSQSANAKGASAGAKAGTKAGASRWLGPIAGIAAGLGIAALLSSLGLSGALLEFLSSAILIGLFIFAIMFIVRRLRGTSGLATATGTASGRSNHNSTNSFKQAYTGQSTPSAGAAPVIEAVASTSSHDPSWFIPEGFDVPAFLEQAKSQFKHIQALWDAGDKDALAELLTDDLLREITPRLPSPDEANITEVVLLNAELMGIEEVAGGHLASVRYSGMLREVSNGQANHFEEVWNLYKTNGQGWLLAGLQQING